MEKYKSEKPDIICEIEKRYQCFSDKQNSAIDLAREDKDFYGGKQWTDELLSKRKNRTCHVNNTLPSQVAVVKNIINSTSVKITSYPVGEDDTDLNIAFQEIIDNINRVNMSDVIFDKTTDDMLIQGHGFVEVHTDYIDSDSFDQDIKLTYIKDPENVFYDTNTREVDYSDMDFIGYPIKISKEDFEEQYPDYSPESISLSLPDQSDVSDSITLVKYYKKEYYNDTLIAFNNIVTGQQESILKSEIDETLLENVDVIQERSIQKAKVKCYLVSGEDILEETEVPCDICPIVPMFGAPYRLTDENADFHMSMIRWVKDSMKEDNLIQSNIIDQQVVAPIAPWIGLDEQIDDYIEDWMSDDPVPMLRYKLVQDAEGRPAPAPSKTSVSEISQGTLSVGQQVKQNIKDVIGLQDAAMGVKSGEESGVAAMLRTDNSASTMNGFMRSKELCMRLAGRIIAQMIPRVIDTPRMINLMGNDDNRSKLLVNQQTPDGKFLDIKNAKYKVYTSTGPNNGQLKKEEQERKIQLLNMLPENMRSVLLPAFIKSMDLSDNDEMATMISRTLPPELTQPMEGENPQATYESQLLINRQMQQQMAQMQQQFQSLQSENSNLKQAILIEQDKLNVQLQEAQLKSQTELRKAQISSETELRKIELQGRNDLAEQSMENQNNIEKEIVSNRGDIAVERVKQEGELKQTVVDHDIAMSEMEQEATLEATTGASINQR